MQRYEPLERLSPGYEMCGPGQHFPSLAATIGWQSSAVSKCKIQLYLAAYETRRTCGFFLQGDEVSHDALWLALPDLKSCRVSGCQYMGRHGLTRSRITNMLAIRIRWLQSQVRDRMPRTMVSGFSLPNRNDGSRLHIRTVANPDVPLPGHINS